MNSYFYLDAQNNQHGPIPPEKFADYGITPSTLVWCKDMPDWMPADSQPELHKWFETHTTQQAFQQQPPQQPQPNYGPQQPYGEAPQQPYGGAQQQPYGGAQQQPYGGAQQPFGNTQNNFSYVPCPSSHMALAVFTTICCCLPFGIVAIIKANDVGKYYAMGNYDAALMASADAQKWGIIALICGILSWSFYSLFALV